MRALGAGRLAVGTVQTRLARAPGFDLSSRSSPALSGPGPSWGAAGHHQAGLQRRS